MNNTTKTFQYGRHTVTLETGSIAAQASGAVMASMGETAVLCAVVGNPHSEPRSFLPLTVDYEERTYAAGRIPGGFFKREGRPSEKAILTCRLIDRSLRPLFPDSFAHEVQIIITVMSVDPEVDPAIVAALGASAALHLSGIPFGGPIATARVGFIDGDCVLNPAAAELTEKSRLDLVVSGTESAVIMVESGASEMSEAEVLEAVMFGHEQLQNAIRVIRELGDEAGIEPWQWQPPAADKALRSAIGEAAEPQIEEAFNIEDKSARAARRTEVREAVKAQFAGDDDGDGAGNAETVDEVLKKVEKKVLRKRVLGGGKRLDGRDNRSVRPISIRTGFLPRTHGSACFTRGGTQAMVVTTLGTERDAQFVDALEGEHRDPFMLHYNFPPYCVGETGRVGSPKRREIGHGKLAKRAIAAVLPNKDKFPYVVRIVSEITESNGSSSMATVCGASLSLMDAGVKIRAPVAGVAMGLIKDGDNYAVLTDILGDEDHLGDMDFKVAGTPKGITALQMDIKIEGINREIMQAALAQAREAREHILGEMSQALAAPREEMSQYAPRIIVIRISPDKIRDIIGKGGSTIRQLSESTGATIDVDDDGTVRIASVDQAGGQAARKRIEQITADVEVGTVYDGRVVRLMDFGAFVNILPGRDGLVHVSQISHQRVENVSDKLREGEVVKVKVLEVDKQGRIRLSMKALERAA